MSEQNDQRERATPQRTLMFGLLFLLLLIAAVILGYVFLGKPAPAPDPTPGQVPPAAPSDPTGEVVAVFDVPVGWKDNSDNEDGFNIYRQRIDLLSGKEKAGASGKDTVSFLDGGTLCGATYQYTVASYNTAGESPTTPCWQITLPACPVPELLKLPVGDKSAAPDVYLSIDGTSLMSDQDGQNGVIDLGNIGSLPLDQVALPQPQNFVKTGVPIVAGNTYAVLMPDGKSVRVLTVNGIDATMADTTAIIWNPGELIVGACDQVNQTPGGPCIDGDNVCDMTCTGGPDRDCPQVTTTATMTATATGTATEPCTPTPNNDCATPTITETATPDCFCQGTTWVCRGQQPIQNDRRCSPTETSTVTEPPPTCPPNSTDPRCVQLDCFCAVNPNTGSWDGTYVCNNAVTGQQVSSTTNFDECPAPKCGNGSVEGLEECDLNTCSNGAACNSDCTCPARDVCTCIPDSPTGGPWGHCAETGKRCQVNTP